MVIKISIGGQSHIVYPTTWRTNDSAKNQIFELKQDQLATHLRKLVDKMC